MSAPPSSTDPTPSKLRRGLQKTPTLARKAAAAAVGVIRGSKNIDSAAAEASPENVHGLPPLNALLARGTSEAADEGYDDDDDVASTFSIDRPFDPRAPDEIPSPRTSPMPPRHAGVPRATSRDRTLASVPPTAAELICSPTLAPRKK